MVSPKPSVRDLADGAVLVDSDEPHRLLAALDRARPDGLLEAIPGARTLLVLFDPERFDQRLIEALPLPRQEAGPRTVRLAAVYDGPDLAQVAAELAMPVEEVVRRHAEAEHRVSFLGFWPGFAYMTGGFAVPRLRSPRIRVPACSLAVADGYTAVYPVESPGGWRLIGRVAARLFEPAKEPPALFVPGDRVVFEPARELPPLPPAEAGVPRGEPVLEVISPGAFTTIQGAPRYGLGRFGVASAGAMDLAALAAANASIGNESGAAALEVTVTGVELLVKKEVAISLYGQPRTARKGERLRCWPVPRGIRGYVAVAGGIEQPLPGEPQRKLQAGDVLRIAPPHEPAPSRKPPPAASAGREIRAARGPQWDFFAEPERFFAAEWTVSPDSDRRGLRLRGEPLRLARPSDIPPEGTAPGSVQVPGEGQPIALGPDRPVTGGYAKIATIMWDDLPLLAQARPGAKLRFRDVTR